MSIATLARRLVAACLVVGGTIASAHDVPPSIVMLDIGRQSIGAELQLPLSELGAALQLPLASQPLTAVTTDGPRIEQYVRERFAIRGRDRDRQGWTMHLGSLDLKKTSNTNWTSNDWLVLHATFDAPAGASTEVFALDDSVIVERVVSHQAMVYVRRDVRNSLLGDRPMLIATAGFGNTHLEIDGSGGSWWRGFRHLFSLGLHHIAEGTDHMLFLLALLLPAPLLASRAAGRARWGVTRGARESVRAIVGVVSGFTVGHSVSLALAACGAVDVPTRLIEVLVAASILVSALHAWRPIFASREIWIAAAFGLVHGLAFAEVLAGLDFDGTTLALSLAGFNLGIEAMQLAVIAATLPLLLWLATTRHYAAIRTAGAAFAGACAAGWVGERAFALPNPLARVVDALAPPPSWFAVAVMAASAACTVALLLRASSRRAPAVAAAARSAACARTAR